MSPRHKHQLSSSSSTTRDSSDAMKNSSRVKAKAKKSTTTVSRSSSIPSLPDVHKPPPTGHQWSFLHTLLAEEQREGQLGEDEEDCMATSAQSSKTLSGETLTARADKILTASWSGAGDTAHSRQRGQQRRHSRDSGVSGLRLSGSLTSKKKLKQRLGHGYDPKQPTGSQRRFSSPVTSSVNVSGTKAVELNLKQEADSVTHCKLHETWSDSMRPPNSCGSLSESEKASSTSSKNLLVSGKPTSDSDSEKLVSESTKVPSDSQKPSDTAQVLSDFQRPAFDSAKTLSDPKRMSLETEKSSSGDVDSQTTPISSEYRPLGSKHVPDTAITSTSSTLTSSPQANPSSTNSTENETVPLSDPFNHWTACRSLDDETDDNNDEDDEGLGNSSTSEAGTQDLYTVGTESSMGEDTHSRAASSNLSRRKRPLLLPPIMLPPIYTVKPTPFVVRDEVYFAGATSRARRPVNDDEWNKLRDCRYLRIRTLRRPIKV